jgi:membrane protein DedA with SNARE-associated domain
MPDPEILKNLILHYGYLALFLGAAVEGLNVMLLAGFLSALHYINPLPAFIAVAAGNFTMDSAIYYLGYFGGEPVLRWIERHRAGFRDSLKTAHYFIHKYPARVFFIVKITTGFAIATILTAGASRMRPRKFLGWNLLANILVAIIVMFLGYFFGNSYLLLYKSFRAWGFVLLIAFILAILYLNYYLRHKFTPQN